MVGLVPHQLRPKAIIHTFLNPDINIIVFIVISYNIQINLVATHIQNILPIPEKQDIISKIFGAKRCFPYKLLKLHLGNKIRLLEVQGSIFVWLEVFLRNEVILKVEQVFLVYIENSMDKLNVHTLLCL